MSWCSIESNGDEENQLSKISTTINGQIQQLKKCYLEIISNVRDCECLSINSLADVYGVSLNAQGLLIRLHESSAIYSEVSMILLHMVEIIAGIKLEKETNMTKDFEKLIELSFFNLICMEKKRYFEPTSIKFALSLLRKLGDQWSCKHVLSKITFENRSMLSKTLSEMHSKLVKHEAPIENCESGKTVENGYPSGASIDFLSLLRVIVCNIYSPKCVNKQLDVRKLLSSTSKRSVKLNTPFKLEISAATGSENQKRNTRKSTEKCQLTKPLIKCDNLSRTCEGGELSGQILLEIFDQQEENYPESLFKAFLIPYEWRNIVSKGFGRNNKHKPKQDNKVATASNVITTIGAHDSESNLAEVIQLFISQVLSLDFDHQPFLSTKQFWRGLLRTLSQMLSEIARPQSSLLFKDLEARSTFSSESDFCNQYHCGLKPHYLQLDDKAFNWLILYSWNIMQSGSVEKISLSAAELLAIGESAHNAIVTNNCLLQEAICCREVLTFTIGQLGIQNIYNFEKYERLRFAWLLAQIGDKAYAKTILASFCDVHADTIYLKHLHESWNIISITLIEDLAGFENRLEASNSILLQYELGEEYSTVKEIFNICLIELEASAKNVTLIDSKSFLQRSLEVICKDANYCPELVIVLLKHILQLNRKQAIQESVYVTLSSYFIDLVLCYLEKGGEMVVEMVQLMICIVFNILVSNNAVSIKVGASLVKKILSLSIRELEHVESFKHLFHGCLYLYFYCWHFSSQLAEGNYCGLETLGSLCVDILLLVSSPSRSQYLSEATVSFLLKSSTRLIHSEAINNERFSSCTMPQLYIAIELLLWENTSKDPAILIKWLHDIMLQVPSYKANNSYWVLQRLLEYIRSIESYLCDILAFMAELYYIVYRCPLAVLRGWTLPPLLTSQNIQDQKTILEIYDFLSLCSASGAFVRQALREAFTWLADMPYIQSHLSASAHIDAFATYFLSSPISSHSQESVPIFEAPPHLICEVYDDVSIGNEIPFRPGLVFRRVLEMGVRSSGNAGVQLPTYQTLFKTYPFLKVLEDTEIINSNTLQTFNYALKDLHIYPFSTFTWCIVFTHICESFFALSDIICAKTLYSPTFNFFDDLISCCTKVSQIPQEASMERVLWPFDIFRLKYEIVPLIEEAFACIFSSKTNEYNAWCKESHASDQYPELIKPSADPFCREMALKSLLLLYTLYRQCQALIEKIFPLIYTKRHSLEQSRWLRVQQQFIVYLNIEKLRTEKNSIQRSFFQRRLLYLFKSDGFNSRDPYHTIMAAKYEYKLTGDITSAISSCSNAFREAYSSERLYSKLEKLTVLYLISTLESKIFLDWKLGKTFCSSFSITSYYLLANEINSIDINEGNIHFLTAMAIRNLEHCIEKEPTHFRAISSMAKAIFQLQSNNIQLSSAGSLLLAATNNEIDIQPNDPKLLDFIINSELSYESSFQYLHRLFHKRRPQILAMWMADNPVTLQDQLMGRLVIFDHFRMKYCLKYLFISPLCNKFSQIFSLLFNALDTKHKNATIYSIIETAVKVICAQQLSLEWLEENGFSMKHYCDKLDHLFNKLNRVGVDYLVNELRKHMCLLINLNISDKLFQVNCWTLSKNQEVLFEHDTLASFSIQWSRLVNSLQNTPDGTENLIFTSKKRSNDTTTQFARKAARTGAEEAE